VAGSSSYRTYQQIQIALEELSIPWKDASVVKLLGKNFGFNIMKNRLDVEIMHVGNDFFQGKVLSELECQV
jgi:hypothetical protein